MTDKKLSDNEIVKALECCVGFRCNCKQRQCPMLNECAKDIDALERYALDLIIRQKAEIERLKKEAEIFADIGKMYSEIKAEAVKEFAERLKEKIRTMDRVILYGEDIDNLVKEMVGDDQ